MLLYSRKKVRYRRDGYCWKKRKDGKTTREDHMKLKVQGTEVSSRAGASLRAPERSRHRSARRAHACRPSGPDPGPGALKQSITRHRLGYSSLVGFVASDLHRSPRSRRADG